MLRHGDSRVENEQQCDFSLTYTNQTLVYPATDRVVAALKDDLAPYEVKKSTIRFPLSEPVPVKLIERIAKLRAKEVTEREKTKAGTPKKR